MFVKNCGLCMIVDPIWTYIIQLLDETEQNIAIYQ